MNKKPAFFFPILLIISLLFFLGCAISSRTEQNPPPEVKQTAAATEILPSHDDPVDQVIEKPLVERQEQQIPEELPILDDAVVQGGEKPLVESEEQPTPEELPILDDAVVQVCEKPLVESQEQPTPEELPIYEEAVDQVIEEPFVEKQEQLTPVEIPSTQEIVVTEDSKSVLDRDPTAEELPIATSQNGDQPFGDIYVEPEITLPIPEVSIIEPFLTMNSEVPAEPNIDAIEQESILENPPMTPEIEIERTPMQTTIFFLGIIILLMIILIIYIVRLRKVQKRLHAEHFKLQGVNQSLDVERKRILVLEIPTIEASLEKQKDLKTSILTLNSNLFNLNDEYLQLKTKRESLQEDHSKLEKKVETQKQKLARTKELYKAIEHAVERFHETEIPSTYYRPLTEEEKVDLDTFAPSVILNLNYLNYQDIRKEFRVNQKQIDVLLEAYAARYTTKANQSIYKLMVISLRSELQNILYNLKHEKLENALLQVQSLIAKYLVIVSEGNQQVAGTMRKFVGELEYLFGNAVKIEYEYYIKKEQARQEQLALRQQMREEAEERRRLDEQKKQIALEESKYQAEIDKVREMLNLEPEDSPKRVDIQAKLDQLNDQLAQVEEKKEEITKLQNGKAGNVYIISNLGSFGEHVFKIGMTRRLDPQDRVDELGSASVPFKFDVHSFIFSENAVGLEGELHQRLHPRRLNKVNLRKEFFDVSIEELEQLVEEINPTAEFNRTMLADDYKQSLSLGDQELPLSSLNDDYLDQEDDQEELEIDENEDQ